MRYVSTRGQAPVLNFEGAMLSGLARDGGLYLPETTPAFGGLNELDGLPYDEVAFRVIRPFTGDSFTDAELRGAIDRAYARIEHTAKAPLRQLAPGHHLLELFGATSGDTGSAAIEAFKGIDNVDVFIMFPHGRVSEVQRRQMTTPDAANIHALAVTGHFDDCQARLKDLFNDHAFRDHVGLAGVNSINWARVVAQIVYYFTACASLGMRDTDFTVPTGNFGDIFAGSIARAMGLPIRRLIVATNQNDILHRALTTGEYRVGTVEPSISPSMDIQVSSNFERALYLAYGGDTAAVSQLMDELRQGGFTISQGALQALREQYLSGRVSEDETLAMIRTIRAETGEILCPHSAVGVAVARQHIEPGVPMVTLATAHPAKFPDAVEAAIGVRPPLPPHMATLFDLPERVTRVENDAQALKSLILDRRTQ